MSRDERERLRDIKDAITAIRAHLERVNPNEPEMDDPLLHDALLFHSLYSERRSSTWRQRLESQHLKSLGPTSLDSAI
ncbi:MAG TPA: hypothetical protein VFP21_00590 [Solirubrobacterales bacterium]|nr:hypothetical protein [Solirubrobacterales bacterium]